MVDYLVDTDEGSVGVLDGWIRDDGGKPIALVVAQGWGGRRRLEIPIEDVIRVDHDDRRVLLTSRSAPLDENDFLQRLKDVWPGTTPDERRDGLEPRPVELGCERRRSAKPRG
jgi:hypothetical protein